MRKKASQHFKRADLHPDVLWSAALRSLPPECRAWSADPRKLGFAKALLGYLTHLVPSADAPDRSLALDCLLNASIASDAELDQFVAASLVPIPALLQWQVFTSRGSTVYVWDPISGPLATFILASPSLPQVSPAPRVEGAPPDPEAFRFLLREKLLLLAQGFHSHRGAHA
jgi:hypothetical protein